MVDPRKSITDPTKAIQHLDLFFSWAFSSLTLSNISLEIPILCRYRRTIIVALPHLVCIVLCKISSALDLVALDFPQ